MKIKLRNKRTREEIMKSIKEIKPNPNAVDLTKEQKQELLKDMRNQGYNL